MATESDLEQFGMLQKMRERSIIRLSKLFFISLTDRAEVLAREQGFPEMKMIYFGFMANLHPDGSTSKEISERMRVSKQAISKLIQEIEQLGFIELHPHQTDRRASVIRLTEKGNDLLNAGLKISEQIKLEVAEKVGKKSMDAMIDTMKLWLEGK
ncbi:MAG: MarR family transcriptional regulator [Chitinophagales bacterium]|nr:MarR family transcriptional regulator [Chitinophagales bacterium]